MSTYQQAWAEYGNDQNANENSDGMVCEMVVWEQIPLGQAYNQEKWETRANPGTERDKG